MQFGSKPFLGSRKGIAEVLGALLLIIVVVVAVAALASFIATAQTNAEARSAYLSNVKNENLQIVNAQFGHNKTKSAGPPPSDPTLWNGVNLTIRNTNTANSQLNQVEVGRFWIPHWNQINSSGKITGPSYGGGSAPLLVPAKGTVTVLVYFSKYKQVIPRNSSVSLTLLTSAGNFFTTVFNPPTSVGQVGLTSVSYTYFDRDVITLDGSKSQSFNGSQIASYLWAIRVPTTAGNCVPSEFSNPLQDTVKSYAPGVVTGTAGGYPNPNGLVPDTLYFTSGVDKGLSFSITANTANTITLSPAPGTAPGSGDQFSVTEYTTAYVTGQTARFFQEQAKPSLLGSPSPYCLDGPFQASLSVTDTNGFEVNSTAVLAALGTDQSLAPIATISASPSALSCSSLTCPSFTIAVQDLFGDGVSGAVVLVSFTGPIVGLSPFYTTDGGGKVMTGALTCPSGGSGTVTLNINNLPAVNIPYSGC
jgi:flagellin-like protein